MLAISTESTSSNNNIYVGGGFSSRNSATNIIFSTAANNTTTTGTERMRITSGGNLLVGVTSGSTARLQSIAADGNNSSLRIGRADNSNFWEFNHAGNDLRIYNQSSSGSHILLGVDPSGTAEANRVGINTAVPNYPLHVAGAAYFQVQYMLVV